MPPGSSSPTVRTAVIPAAGLGTRFLPATKAIPKEMLPIVDIPTIQYIVEEAVASGITKIVLVTGRGKEAIAAHFDYAPDLDAELAARGKNALRAEIRRITEMVDVVSVRQEEPLGLGHAVLTAQPAVGDEPFAVMLPDDLIHTEPPTQPGIRQLTDVFDETGKGVVALLRVASDQAHLYGIVKFDEVRPRLFQIFDMVEKPPPGQAPSDLAIIGRYVFPPSIFPILADTRPGVGGEIQVTDGIRILAETEGVMGVEFEGERCDAGDKLGYLEAQIAYGLRHPTLGPPLRDYLCQVMADKK